MLRRIITISFLIISFAYAGAQDSCLISLQFKGLGKSYVSLAYHLGDRQYIKDTIYTDKNGRALYNEEVQEQGLYMIVFPDNNIFEFIVSDNQEFGIECNTDDIISSLRFTGSEENTAFISYRRKWMDFQESASELRLTMGEISDIDSLNMLREKLRSMEKEMLKYIRDEADEYRGSIFSALLQSMLPLEVPEFNVPPDSGNTDSLRWVMSYHYNRDHFFDNTALNDPRLIRTPILHNKLKTYFSGILIQAPDSIMAVIPEVIARTEGNQETFRYVISFLFNHFRESQIMGHDAIVVMIAEEYYLSGKADWVDDKFLEDLSKDVAMIKPSLIGRKAVDITMETYSGVYKSLHDINSDFTILYFWEPDCGHCKTVTPELKKYYDSNRNNGIEVFAVCTQDDREEWEKYIAENGLEWINGWDPARSTGFDFYYNVRATPLIYVLNREKEIIAKKLPVANLEDFIKQYRRLYYD